jgi:hypothetical protein
VLEFIKFGKDYDTNLVEIKPNTIHTVVPLTSTLVIFEVKGQTNYDPSKDKSFYTWAPSEKDDPEKIEKYLNFLYSIIEI